MVRELIGWRKNLFLTKVYFTNRWVRKLPWSFKIYLRKVLNFEKFTKIGHKVVILSQVPPYPSEAFNRYFEGLVSSSEGHHPPLSLECAITNKCKYDCWHCSNKYRKGLEPSFDDLTKAINNFVDLGVTWVGLSGGEPLLRDDIVDIVRSIGSKASTAIFTTGYNLTETLGKKLKSAGLFSFVISLDSSEKKVHDKLRGFPGAFENALKGIETSLEFEFYTVVSTVATHSNVSSGELERLVQFCKTLGVHEVRILELAQTGKILNTKPDLITSQDRNVLYELHRTANKSSKYPRVMAFPYLESSEFLGCTGGFHHITIDAQGNVCPCPFTPLSFGNVFTEDISSIWSRLKKHFPTPRCSCINSENVNYIQEDFSGKLPLPYDISASIMEKSKPTKVPIFYQKLKKK